MLQGYRDLKVYQLAYELAMEICRLSKAFPRLAEGFRKSRYPNAFLNKLTDCDAEASETQVWIVSH